MKKLWTLVLAFALALGLSACGGGTSSAPAKTYESTDQVVQEVITVKVPKELTSKESANWGGIELTQAGETWVLGISSGGLENVNEKATWDAAVETWKQGYDYKDAKVAGKDGGRYDAGAALNLVAPINDKVYLNIRVKDTANDTPEARAKVLDKDIVKFVLANITTK